MATISGQVAYDFDGDGLLEADEPGLADWQVYIDADNDGQLDTGEQAVLSDAAGNYQLTDLSAGFQTVRIVPQAGWQQTFPPGIGKHTIDVRTADQVIGGINFAQQRIFTDFVPGNVLVTRSSLADTDLLLEYAPDGALVQAVVIPGTEDDSTVVAKDLVIDSQGNVQIFQAGVVTDPLPGGNVFRGYEDVHLNTFIPGTQTFTPTEVENWDIRRTFDRWGDVAAFGDYVFANEQIDDAGTANGVIRFDARDLSYERFSEGFAMPTDLTVGSDGLLYTLNATFNNTTVQVHEPETMQLVRTFNIPQRLRSAAVDEEGEIYAVTDTGLKHFSSTGALIKSDAAHTGDDIILGDQGQLLLTNKLAITVTDTDFGSFSSIKVPGNAGVNFLAYAALVQDPVGDGPGVGDDGQFGVFTAGNILVSNSPATSGAPKLYEYTPFGELVQEHDIPILETGGARDLVMDVTGRVHVYNGTFDPHLTTFTSTPFGVTTDSRQYGGWSTADRPTFGGLATYGEFVYATDVKTQFDARSERGIVRYNMETEVFERFASNNGDIIDVNIGLDGLLYTLGPSNTRIGTEVRQYHPVTMQLLKTVNLPAHHRAIAVDGNGDIFAVYPNIHRYSADGVPLGQPLEDGGIGDLSDVDFDTEGRLLVAASNGHVLLTNRSFASPVVFETRVSDGQNFAAFVSPARPFPKANRDAFTVAQNSVDNDFDVLANDRLQDLGSLTIDQVEQGSEGGTVTILGNTAVRYSPAANFVGEETFTYTLTDGLGNFDRAVVTVNVEGNANFFVVDDSYTVVEDNTLIVDDDDPLVLPLPLLLDNDGSLDIFPVLTPGNLLVTHSPVGSDVNALLQEYTPNGTLVRSILLPDFSGGFGDARDLVVDRSGRVQIYNGTFTPRLTTYDPVTDQLSHQTFTNWNTTANVTYGGLAAWRDFVFATDQEVAGDHPTRDEGIIRFDITAGTSERFVNDGDFIDLNVGLDGKLYALGPSGTPASRHIMVFDPATMAQEGMITGMHADTRAITVDEDGDIYAVRFRNPNVYHYDGSGALQRTFNTGLNSRPGFNEADFSDIDLHENGQDLLIANVNFSNTSITISPRDGDVVLVSAAFNRAARVLQAPDQNSDMKFATWIQAPVGSLNEPLLVVANTQPSHGTLSLESDGSFTYVPDENFVGRDGFRYVVSDADGKRRDASVSLTVTPVNDQPVLEPAAPAFDSDEDATLTIPLTALINGGVDTTAISDADVNDPLGGIAVTSTSGPGAWSFSVDGSVFVDIGVVSDTEALLLPYSYDIRFTPSGGAGGTASFTYRAWDRTVGVEGNKFPTTYEVCVAGGVPDEDGLCPDLNPPEEFVYENYSEVKDTVSIDLSDLNDAPVLVPSQPTLGLTDEHTALDIAVGQFAVGMSDPDGSSGDLGIALVGSTGNGGWEYSLDGQTYTTLPQLGDATALVLDRDDRLRYTPDQRNGEVATISYRGWDKTDGFAAGDLVDTSINGGATAYSAAVDSGQLGVSDVNDAPVLVPASPHIATTDVVTIATAELNDFVSGISDVDRGASVGGIAVVAATGEGVWSFSNDGVSFEPFPAGLDVTAALLLHRNDSIRYTPAGGDPESAVIRYAAWDATTGSGGTTADTTTRGGTSAFSLDEDEATLTVKEVNDPPELLGLTVPQTYAENDPPTAVFPDLVVTDPDSADFDSGSMTASILNGGTPNDRLMIATTDDITVIGDTLFYENGGPQLIGSFAIEDWVVTVNFATSQATPAAAQAVARAIVYENLSDDPTSTNRLLRLTVIDGDIGNDTTTITQTMTIQPINDPPQPGADEYQLFTGSELRATSLNGVLSNDTDAEDDDLTAELFALPSHGTLTLADDGSFTYTPATLFHGIDTFRYRAFDGQDYSAATTVVLHVDLPPTNPAYVADVNADGWVSAQDPVRVANYLIANGTGALPDPYTPPPFVDVDGDGSVTEADVDAAANDVNALGARRLPPPRLELPQTPPVLGSDELIDVQLRTTDATGMAVAEISAGEVFYVEVWVADSRPDPYGVAAAYLDIQYDWALAVPAGTIAASGDYPDFLAGTTTIAGVIDELGAGRRSPLEDNELYLLARVPMQALTRGDAVFASNAADQMPVSQTLLFGIDGPIPAENIVYGGTTISITGPPQAMNDQYPMDEDDVLVVDVADGVLQNDSDDDNDPLTAVLVDEPENGTLQLNDDGSFRYEPQADFFGADRFVYVANDGTFDSNRATVAITVAGSNDPPVAFPDQYSVFRNEVLTADALTGVLANDEDVDNDPLEADVVDPPDHGTVALRDDGSFTYTPDADFGGPDQFTYRVWDGTVFSNVATVDINVYFGWQNPTHPVDVNGDGFASPLDALFVFNELERNGTRTLPNPPVPPDTAPPFLDVNGDGVVSSFDGRKVIDDLALNGSRQLPEPRTELPQTPPDLGTDPLVEFHVQTLDSQGQPRAQFAAGETILARISVQDLRVGGAGLFSAYLDLLFDAGGLDVSGPLNFGPAFNAVRTGTVAAGLVDEAGGVQATRPMTNVETVLLEVHLVGTAEGDFQITADAANISPQSDVTLYDIDGPIPPELIVFDTATVSITVADGDGDGVMDLEEDGAPNGGDGNDDGTPDRLQSHIASLGSDQTGQYVTIAVPSQHALTGVSTVANPSPGDIPAGIQFPLGLLQFNVTGVAAGESVTASMYLEPGAQANTFYRFGTTPTNPTPGWYAFLAGRGVGARVYGDRLEVQLQAGGRGDDEPANAGVSVMFAAPGLSQTPWKNPVLGVDIDNDGFAKPSDALALINRINSGGDGQLPLIPTAQMPVPFFWDPDGNNVLSASDILTVIDHLNSQAAGGGEGEAADPGSSRFTLRSGGASVVAFRGNDQRGASLASPDTTRPLAAASDVPAEALQQDPDQPDSASEDWDESLTEDVWDGIGEILDSISSDIADQWSVV